MGSVPSSASRNRSRSSRRGPDSESDAEADDVPDGIASQSSGPSTPTSSGRSRSHRGDASHSAAPSPPARPKRSRPASLASRGGITRQRVPSAKPASAGLPEEDAEVHTRPHPDARGSTSPELPLAQDDEDDDGDDEPPGLDDAASTIDYRDQEDAESEQDLDSEGDFRLDPCLLYTSPSPRDRG